MSIFPIVKASFCCAAHPDRRSKDQSRQVGLKPDIHQSINLIGRPRAAVSKFDYSKKPKRAFGQCTCSGAPARSTRHGREKERESERKLTAIMDGMVAVGPAPAASTQPLRQGATTAKPASEPVPNTIFNPTTQQSFTRGKLLGKVRLQLLFFEKCFGCAHGCRCLQGGFAKVYEAFEDATGTWFAIKVVDKKIIRSSSARQKVCIRFS